MQFQLPVSFSTCTMITVRCGSTSFRCASRAAKARLSASREAAAKGEGESTAWPFLSSACA